MVQVELKNTVQELEVEEKEDELFFENIEDFMLVESEDDGGFDEEMDEDVENIGVVSNNDEVVLTIKKDKVVTKKKKEEDELIKEKLVKERDESIDNDNEEELPIEKEKELTEEENDKVDDKNEESMIQEDKKELTEGENEHMIEEKDDMADDNKEELSEENEKFDENKEELTDKKEEEMIDEKEEDYGLQYAEKVKASREEKYTQKEVEFEIKESQNTLDIGDDLNDLMCSTGYTTTLTAMITATLSTIFCRQLRAFLSGGLMEKGIFGSRAWRAFNIWRYFFKVWFLGNFRTVLDKIEEWQQQVQTLGDVSLQRKEIED